MTSTSGTVKVGKYKLEKFNMKNDFSYGGCNENFIKITEVTHGFGG